jgi:hypothetical protein
MRQVALFTIAAGFIVPLMASAPASAQATRTWVSGVGDDVNPCSRTAPCKTFAGALSKTAAGGEINCLDGGGFGAVSPNKSMTISCEAGTAGVLVAGGNGINFNGAAADVLYLKGLDFEGLNKTTGGVGVIGISFNTGAAIRNFSTFGISFKPSGNATFVVQRTTLWDNTSGAIQVRPTGGVSNGTVEKVAMNRNGSGITLDGFGGGAATNVTVHDSVINGNTADGALVNSTVAGNLMIQNSAIANNGTGLRTVNGGATIRVGSSSITGNGTAVNGATVLSYLNNQLNGNGGGEAINPVPGGLK